MARGGIDRFNGSSGRQIVTLRAALAALPRLPIRRLAGARKCQ
jgi:hypothetical protein